MRLKSAIRGASVLATVAAVLLGFAGASLAQSASDPHGTYDCDECHGLHGSFGVARNTAQETMCVTCHNATGDAKDLTNSFAMHEVTHATNGSLTIDCGSCHEVHGAMTLSGETVANKWLLRTDIDKYGGTSRFTPLSSLLFNTDAGTASDYIQSSSPYNGVCQTCHTSTDNHQNDGDGSSHETSTNCMTCHTHGGGFAGGSCTTCHDSTQDNDDGAPTRRAMLGEFTYTDAYASQHPVTDPDGIGSEVYDAADCEVCHDQADHKDNKLDFKRYEVTPATVITLSGDPFTSSTEAAKLDDFCLDCHDDPASLADDTPFADGVATPPEIDKTAWLASSHESSTGNPLSCFGDSSSSGNEHGCHSGGHGSKMASLLGPYDTAVGDDNNPVEQEEGLCFNCHTNNGVAATDIEADFSANAAWVTASAGLQDVSTMNDRHDIEDDVQATSGAEMECWDCHDPHVVNPDGTYAYVVTMDPDPRDTHYPETPASWYFSGS
ncbi:MAG: cytochrome c3 family protein, partial [Planctomycetota bacterium]